MRRVPRLFVLISLVGLLFLALATQTAHAQADEDDPSPTASPADSDLAAKFARQGRYEEAIGAYKAVIAEGDLEERVDAHLEVAKVLLDDGQTTAAVQHLDAFLIEAQTDTDVRPAQYLLAEALSDQGRWQEALALYDAYIEQVGPLSLYAGLGRAEALAALGRVTEAAEQAERSLETDLASSVKLGLVLSMAQQLEVSDPREAIVWYERLASESEFAADDALALWRAAQLRSELGESEDFVATWRTIIQQYPESPTAQAIVDDPPELSPLVDYPLFDPYYTGFVHYQAGRINDASADFEESIELAESNGDGSLAASAAFYLGVIAENAGDFDEAIDRYGEVVALDPDNELAPDALWWEARLHEREGRRAAATVLYQRLVSDYNGSDWAPEARFRLALLDYDRSEYDAAADAFEAIAEDASDAEERRARLWLGKALTAAGDEEAADQTWSELRDEAPSDYYGLRAAVLLGEADGAPGDASLDELPEIDRDAIEAWLFDPIGTNPDEGLSLLLRDVHWRLGQELLVHGMEHSAGREFEALLQNAGENPAELYQLAFFFRDSGLTHFSSRAATRLLDALPEERREEAPLDLWRLAYPVVYPELLQAAADRSDVPDILVLAVIRQESFFDPLAGSSAGALGLTQIIPATGRAIARDAEVADFEVDDLFRPGLNLDFGARYLGDQLERFGGNVYHALAAYNGGPDAAQRWADEAGGDIDRFVTEIEFGQTVAYVQLVSENLARYRQLYQDLEEPALPGD